jgi:thiamine pyrophosphate-dependent acetolactate synthase large subunit-like protein
LDDLATADAGGGSLRPEFVASTLDELASQDAVFMCDVGTPAVWASPYLAMNGKRRLIGSSNHRSVACPLPQACGGQALDKRRQVISMSGDGGLAMLMGKRLTAKQNQLAIKVIVFNNGAMAFVELEIKAAGVCQFAYTRHPLLPNAIWRCLLDRNHVSLQHHGAEACARLGKGSSARSLSLLISGKRSDFVVRARGQT